MPLRKKHRKFVSLRAATRLSPQWLKICLARPGIPTEEISEEKMTQPEHLKSKRALMWKHIETDSS